MGDVPDVARQEVAVRSRHRISLEARFQGQKAVSKLSNDCLYANVTSIDQAVGPVRPNPWVMSSTPASHARRGVVPPQELKWSGALS